MNTEKDDTVAQPQRPTPNQAAVVEGDLNAVGMVKW